MAGYTGAGPGMGAMNTTTNPMFTPSPEPVQMIGSSLGQGSTMSGGNPFGAGQMSSAVQRMPGGFGLSPQLLSMIAGLQSRNPQFTTQTSPPQVRPPVIPNPYSVAPQNVFGMGGGGSYPTIFGKR